MAIAMIVNGTQSNKLSFQVCPDTLQNSREAHPKAFKIVFRQALKNAMYCHLKRYSCTSSGTRILPEVS